MQNPVQTKDETGYLASLSRQMGKEGFMSDETAPALPGNSSLPAGKLKFGR